MNKYLNIFSSFVIMLCLGGVYAWSLFVPVLSSDFGFSSLQTQLIFGTVISVFTLTMIFAGNLERKAGPRFVVLLAAAFFSAGYILASFSGGNFFIVYTGIGLLAGIGTGLGYLVALTNPPKWFPEKKGLIKGIAAGGFGLGAICMTYLANPLFAGGHSILSIFRVIGITYGLVLVLFSFGISKPAGTDEPDNFDKLDFIRDRRFKKMVYGIFAGTFSGLLVIGSLKPIGMVHAIQADKLVFAIALFSIANFAGRIIWGWISDKVRGEGIVSVALSLLAVFTLLIGNIPLTVTTFYILSVAVGFCFGANFVLFAKLTSDHYGMANVSKIYPYIFLGYGFAGVAGPITGGIVYDLSQSYGWASVIAFILSLSPVFLFSNKKAKVLWPNQ